MGGSRGGLAATKDFLAQAMAGFAGFQHMVATSKLSFDGDTATGRTICHNPMVLDKGNGQTHVFFCGLWYRDTFVRTPGRMAHQRAVRGAVLLPQRSPGARPLVRARARPK